MTRDDSVCANFGLPSLISVKDDDHLSLPPTSCWEAIDSLAGVTIGEVSIHVACLPGSVPIRVGRLTHEDDRGLG
jgi:hypothetical protein